MFRHIVVMKFKRPLTTAEAARVRRSLDDLGVQSPDVRGFSHGPDLGVRPGGYDWGLVADFDDSEGWRAYSAHPAHDVVRDVMRDLVEAQSVVQFDVQARS
ncbi:Dabb family protein [Nocardia jiangxiensis]|uniref:Dabb family protein n=1 Tax=Nocardia jiangxiensis TaxID=282685 RepID=A0ABW6SC76_9NOCA|nr:Dabb family protein [Nocardia jiangxiensis]